MAHSKETLPDFLIADLYKHSLVILDQEKSTQPAMHVTREAFAMEPVLTAEPVEIAVQPLPQKTSAKKEKPAVAPPPRAQWFLGENRKKITLVVSETEAAYLEDESLQFLSSILAACKLNLGDVAIVNYERDALSYQEFKEKLAPAFLILFDVNAKQVLLPFTIPFYQVQKYDSCQFLLAPSLNRMLGDSQEAKLEKSKLWLSLKKMFSIN